MSIDYAKAAVLLSDVNLSVEKDLLEGSLPSIDADIIPAFDVIFQSKTQAYREVLLGCVIAHILDPSIDISLPYVEQGEHAFSGRSLDERMVNPFFQSRRIPSSRGPYGRLFLPDPHLPHLRSFFQILPVEFVRHLDEELVVERARLVVVNEQHALAWFQAVEGLKNGLVLDRRRQGTHVYGRGIGFVLHGFPPSGYWSDRSESSDDCPIVG